MAALRSRWQRRLAGPALVGAILAALVSAAPTQAVTVPVEPLDGAALQAVQQSRDYPVLWLERAFEGLPLTAVIRSDRPQTLPGVAGLPRLRRTTFLYGTCEIPETPAASPRAAVGRRFRSRSNPCAASLP